jgi:gamma-glutamylcysteine synthetase
MTVATALHSPALTLESASEYIYEAALADTDVGAIGLEVETHLVDLAAVPDRVPWPRLHAAVGLGPGQLSSSALSVEPGGQVELSGAPMPGIAQAVAVMRHDEQRLRLVLAEHDLGLAHLGADPLRAPRRVNPRPRYRAMERHFIGTGRSEAGAIMMCATAALQVNLQLALARRARHRLGVGAAADLARARPANERPGGVVPRSGGGLGPSRPGSARALRDDGRRRDRRSRPGRPVQRVAVGSRPPRRPAPDR